MSPAVGEVLEAMDIPQLSKQQMSADLLLISLGAWSGCGNSDKLRRMRTSENGLDGLV